jgi:hypothetical protein
MLNNGWTTKTGGLNRLIQPSLLIPDFRGHPHPRNKMLSTMLLNLFSDQGHLLCTECHHTPTKSLNTIILNQFMEMVAGIHQL